MNGLCSSTRSYNGYSKMDIEDPEEMSHRKAQFLIYKSLKKVDSLTQRRRSQSLLKLRVFRLKIRIGKRLRRLRKSFSLSFSAAVKGGAGGGVCKQVCLQFKSWKRLLRGTGREAMVSVVPPL